jgi:hypothetical protein
MTSKFLNIYSFLLGFVLVFSFVVDSYALYKGSTCTNDCYWYTENSYSSITYTSVNNPADTYTEIHNTLGSCSDYYIGTTYLQDRTASCVLRSGTTTTWDCTITKVNAFVACQDLEAENSTCSNEIKDSGEVGIDCGGECSEECKIACASGSPYEVSDWPGVYYCAESVPVNSDGTCNPGYVLTADGENCHKYTDLNPIIADDDYFAKFDISSDETTTLPTDNGTTNSDTTYAEQNPDETSTTDISTTTTTNSDGSTSTIDTKTVKNSDGSTTTTTTTTTINSDGSKTVTTVTTSTDSSGTTTGRSSTSTSYDSDGNVTGTSTSSSGDQTPTDPDDAGIGGEGGEAEAFGVGEGSEVGTIASKFTDRFDLFVNRVSVYSGIDNIDEIALSIPEGSHSADYTINFGTYGSHTIEMDSFDNAIDFIGYLLMILATFVGYRLIFG